MNVFEKLYKELKRKYGRPKGQWKLWCKRPKTEKEREEVIIGAILTQRTNWKNVELAINNLKRVKINPAPFFKKIVRANKIDKKWCGVNSLENIYRLGPKKIENLIKPSGFYKTKAQYLFNLVKHIIKNYGSLEKMKKKEFKGLREELLKLKGIGPETADSILLYALDKPIFVIDEYTRRLVKESNLAAQTNYQFLQRLFEESLRRDFKLYQDFHALIVINGKNRVAKIVQ